jgi:hypothetical protein
MLAKMDSRCTISEATYSKYSIYTQKADQQDDIFIVESDVQQQMTHIERDALVG